MSSSSKADVFDMNEANPGSPQPVAESDTAVETTQKTSSSGNGMLGILVVGVLVVVLVVGGILLWKYCSSDGSPMGAGHQQAQDRRANPNQQQRSSESSSERPIRSLDDIEIKTPEQWAAVMSGNKDPVWVVACTMTGCGPCTQFKPNLLNAAKKCKHPIHMFNYGGEQWKQAELSKLKVEGFPTVYRFAKGQPPQEYRGDRSEASVVQFAETGSG